jgi:hypothetical protein
VQGKLFFLAIWESGHGQRFSLSASGAKQDLTQSVPFDPAPKNDHVPAGAMTLTTVDRRIVPAAQLLVGWRIAGRERLLGRLADGRFLFGWSHFLFCLGPGATFRPDRRASRLALRLGGQTRVPAWRPEWQKGRSPSDHQAIAYRRIVPKSCGAHIAL